MTHQVRREKALRLEELCRTRRIPVTHQRRAVLDAVAERSDHPTADEVYEDVRRRLPNVSRTTVYRVLELTVDLGLVTKIGHPRATIRFDPRTELHHHLICLHCNKLIDLEDPALNALELPNTRRLGFKVSDYSIHFRGVCRACQRAQDGRSAGPPLRISRTTRR
jgi:Fur family peroxide stress response transcriptional regulator